ncbi:MAG: hypothetical protein IKU39_02955 [Lachnospiraceae bacterium]|nr:hypothetical protein [Lachnospiraceae bacterium]
MEVRQEKYMKKIKSLFYLNCIALISIIAAWIPALTNWIGWGNIVISNCIAVILFGLADSNTRYQKAAIFRTIVVAISILSKFIDSSILSLATSIILFCSIYQEYNAHSEVLAGVDEKLSKRWKELFSIYLWGSVLTGILSSVIVISLGALFLQYATVIIGIVLFLSGGFDIIMRIIYLVYLKQVINLQ